MRISNGYPDPLIGCTMFPEDSAPEDFGFGAKAGAAPPRVASGLDDPSSIRNIGSGLDAPPPPPLDPNNPADALKVGSGL